MNFEEIKFIWCKAFKISNKWDYSITMIHTNLFSNIRISCAFIGPLTMLMLTCFYTILISVNHSNQIVPHRFQSTVSFWGSDQGLDKGRKRHICKIKQNIKSPSTGNCQIKQPPKSRSKSNAHKYMLLLRCRQRYKPSFYVYQYWLCLAKVHQNIPVTDQVFFFLMRNKRLI